MNHNHRPPQVALCPAPEQVTAAHIDNLLSVVECLKPFLLPLPRDPQSSIPQPAERLDGEAAVAAVSTVIKVCEKLDALIADESRWTLRPHAELYAAINANYHQQFEFLKAQTAAANNLSRPFFLLKPDLVQLEDGLFLAFWGDIETPGAGLMGQGATPAAAFSDFDAAYFRQDQIQIQAPPGEVSPIKLPVPHKLRKKKK